VLTLILSLTTLFGAFVAPASATEASVVSPAAAAACNSAWTVDAIAPYNRANGRTQGLLELRFNSCNRTIWARITTSLPGGCVPADTDCGYATIHRNSDGLERHCSTARGAKTCFTAAIDDRNVTSYASGSVDAGAYVYSARTINY